MLYMFLLTRATAYSATEVHVCYSAEARTLHCLLLVLVTYYLEVSAGVGNMFGEYTYHTVQHIHCFSNTLKDGLLMYMQIHANADDFGLGGFPDSLTTGHAGGRVGCCTIGIARGN